MLKLPTFPVDVENLKESKTVFKEYITSSLTLQVQTNQSLYNKEELITLLTQSIEENYEKIFDEIIEEIKNARVLMFNDLEGVEKLINSGVCGTRKIHPALYREDLGTVVKIDCSVVLPPQRLNYAPIVAETFVKDVFEDLLLERFSSEVSQILAKHAIITFGDD